MTSKLINEVAENLRVYSGLTDFGDGRHSLKEEATTLGLASNRLKKAVKLLDEISEEVSLSGGSTSFPTGEVEKKLERVIDLLTK